MADIDVNALRKLIDEAITQWAAGTSPDESPNTAVADKPERELPKDKRVVRTKASGDRVYFIDEEKKIRQWVTNPEILKSLGFELSDVNEVDDAELLRYQQVGPLYRVETS
jgi:hypothetical protein